MARPHLQRINSCQADDGYLTWRSRHMPQKREHPYIWATWLPCLLTGENSCEWAFWFKAHYQNWERVPSDSDQARRRPPRPISRAEARSTQFCAGPVRGSHSGSSAETEALWRSSPTHQRLHTRSPLTAANHRRYQPTATGRTVSLPAPDAPNSCASWPREAPNGYCAV